MKRMIALLLALCSLLSLAACGNVMLTEAPEATEAPEEAQTLLEAEDPAMTRRPLQEDYLEENGWELREEYYELARAWRQELAAQRALPEEEAESLTPWLRAGIPSLLGQQEGENLAFSPLNLYLALAMLAEVTDGQSRQQILDLLGAEDPEALRRSAGAVWRTSYQNDGQTTSLLASSLWLSSGIDYHRETLELLRDCCHASSFRGEMGSPAYDALLQDWINEQTGNLLREQAAGVHMDAETVLSLVTTLYFQAGWEDKFWDAATGDGLFHSPEGEETVSFMHKSETRHYFWGEHFGAVGLEMENGGDMWLLLPEEGTSPEELARDEELMDFLLCRDKFSWDRQQLLTVNLSLPKFDVSADLRLEEALRDLGVRDVFLPGAADFSPLTDDAENLAVSQVRHAARVRIDEEGCEAAAYTVISVEVTGAAPPEEELDFVLDRPFLFVVTNGAGLPLFVGVVNHPAAA